MNNTIYYILKKSWSIKTSSLWTENNPSKGQCSVTSLVIHNQFGGSILKTLTTNGWHFYNSLNGKRYDFTKNQFAKEMEYSDLLSSEEEAFLDTSQTQYQELLIRFVQEMNLIGSKSREKIYSSIRTI